MHVEVCLDLASFFLEQHRKQEARAKPASECGEEPRAPARTEVRRRVAVPREQIGPDNNVPIFDVGQARIDVLLFRIGFRGGEEAVQIRRIGFILPMVLERVYVDLGTLGPCLGGLERRRHFSISPDPVLFCTGNP